MILSPVFYDNRLIVVPVYKALVEEASIADVPKALPRLKHRNLFSDNFRRSLRRQTFPFTGFDASLYICQQREVNQDSIECRCVRTKSPLAPVMPGVQGAFDVLRVVPGAVAYPSKTTDVFDRTLRWIATVHGISGQRADFCRLKVLQINTTLYTTHLAQLRQLDSTQQDSMTAQSTRAAVVYMCRGSPQTQHLEQEMSSKHPSVAQRRGSVSGVVEHLSLPQNDARPISAYTISHKGKPRAGLSFTAPILWSLTSLSHLNSNAERLYVTAAQPTVHSLISPTSVLLHVADIVDTNPRNEHVHIALGTYTSD